MPTITFTISAEQKAKIKEMLGKVKKMLGTKSSAMALTHIVNEYQKFVYIDWAALKLDDPIELDALKIDFEPDLLELDFEPDLLKLDFEPDLLELDVPVGEK